MITTFAQKKVSNLETCRHDLLSSVSNWIVWQTMLYVHMLYFISCLYDVYDVWI
jgi:hypothetical protein